MRWKTAEFRKKHVIREESYQKIRELIQASPHLPLHIVFRNGSRDLLDSVNN